MREGYFLAFLSGAGVLFSFLSGPLVMDPSMLMRKVFLSCPATMYSGMAGLRFIT